MKTPLLVVLLACSMMPASSAQVASDTDVRSKIVALENLWNQAAEAKDMDALDRILDNAFIYVAPDGRLMTKRQVLGDVKAAQGIRVLSESMIVHLHGDTAIVTGVYKIRGMDHGKPFVRTDRFVDTWRFKNGSWVSIASLATPIVS